MVFCSRCGRLQSSIAKKNEYRMDLPNMIVHHYPCECGNDIVSYEIFQNSADGWVNTDFGEHKPNKRHF